jgi:hypothetical protein
MFGPYGGLIAAGGSSALALGSSFTTTLSPNAAVEAADTSSMILAGEYSIANSGPNGTAVQNDHVSSLSQVNGALYGHAAVPDSIVGAGMVEEQSTMEPGQGLLTSNPSITWIGTITGGEHRHGRDLANAGLERLLRFGQWPDHQRRQRSLLST